MAIHKKKRKKQRPSKSLKRIQEKGQRYSGQLRRNMTVPEKTLYNALNNAGIIFQTQRLFFNEKQLYIADFYFKRYNKNGNRGLVVEVDGKGHHTEKGKAYDERRRKWLWVNKNVYIMRFTNEQVMTDVESVVDAVIEKGVIVKEFKVSMLDKA
jgi:very-short-patch-repair endonuclease